MGIEAILGAVVPLFGSIFGGGQQQSAPAPEKDNRPDETSEGIAEARQRRRALAARTGRSGLTNNKVEGGQVRSGLTIDT